MEVKIYNIALLPFTPNAFIERDHTDDMLIVVMFDQPSHESCSINVQHVRWLPRVITKHPPYRARVMKGNVVNFS